LIKNGIDDPIAYAKKILGITFSKADCLEPGLTI